VRRTPELELLAQSLSITTFRYVPAELSARIGDPAVAARVDNINRELLDRLQRGGELFVSNAVVGGRYALRACVVNFQTREADIEAVPAIVVRVGRAVTDETDAATR
jgi:aromatic-L-amino-acid decarboxylase